jgi:ribosomal protein S13
MNKHFPKLLLSITIGVGINMGSSLRAGGLDNTWLTNTNTLVEQSMTIAPNASHSSGAAGSFYLGSASIRKKFGVHRPFTAQAPKLNVGCGGIDAFLGGMESVIDKEWIQSRAEGVIQAAPYAAFEIGLKTYCPTCLETIRSIQAIVDKINAIAIDECASAKAVVALAADKVSGEEKAAEHYSNYMEESGLSGFWGNTKKEIDNQNDITQSRKGCPGIAGSMVSDAEHSLINVVARQAGMDSDSSIIMRAFLGDVEYRPNSGKLIQIAPCYEISEGLTALMPETISENQTILIRNYGEDTECTTGDFSLNDELKTQIEAVIDGMKDKSAYTEGNLILNKGVNPQALVRMGMEVGMSDQFYVDIIDYIRVKIVLGLLKDMTGIGDKVATEIAKEATRTRKTQTCDPPSVFSDFEGVIEPIEKLSERYFKATQKYKELSEEKMGKMLAQVKDQIELNEKAERTRRKRYAKQILKDKTGQ